MSSLLDCPIREQNWLKEATLRNGIPSGTGWLHGVNKDQKVVPEAGPWEPAVREMVAFQHLGDNWDGQGAQAPSDEVLGSAIGLAYFFYEQGVEPPSRVVPGPQSSVIFEWQDPDGTYTEVEVVNWLFAEVMRLELGKPAQHWTLPTK
jgi:hypothetical protein